MAQITPPPRIAPSSTRTARTRALLELAGALTAACIGAAALLALEPDPPPVECAELARVWVCVYEDGTVTGNPR